MFRRPVRRLPSVLLATVGVVLLAPMLLQANAAYASGLAERPTSEREIERTANRDEREPSVQRAPALASAAENKASRQATQMMVMLIVLGTVVLVILSVPVGFIVWYRRRSRRLTSQWEAMGAELGPVLLQKRLSKGTRVIYWIFGVFCLYVGIGAGIAGFSEAWFVGLASVAVPWAFGIYILHRATNTILVHKYGVVGRSLLGLRKLLHSEISRLTYVAIRHYRDDTYAGTELLIRFTPEVGKPITYAQYSRENDQEMDALRDHIAWQIAEPLLERVRRGQQVSWGAFDAVFTRDALRVGDRTVPYSAGLRSRIEQGIFSLYVSGENNPILTMGCDAENFYPGLMMLGTLLEGAKAARREPSVAS
ncbi:hypothetical protein NR798_12735 [Archangium gephyra]|uniref:hypothetical protein n=1 Tax=Archangium gephyra TaxID=48 RepID=UPI0035D44034